MKTYKIWYILGLLFMGLFFLSTASASQFYSQIILEDIIKL